MIKNVHWSSCKVTVTLVWLIKLQLIRQIFEWDSNIKLQENPSCGGRVVPCGQTGVTKLIVAFGNFANTPINDIQYWHCHTMMKLHTAQPVCERGKSKICFCNIGHHKTMTLPSHVWQPNPTAAFQWTEMNCYTARRKSSVFALKTAQELRHFKYQRIQLPQRTLTIQSKHM